MCRVKLRDQDAWQRLVHLYQPLVFVWCRKAGLADCDVADVSQELWTAVASHIAGFRRDRPKDNFRGWLLTILRSKLSDHWPNPEPSPVGGTRGQEIMDGIPGKTLDSSDQVANEETLLIRRALELIRAEFEDRTWQAFWRTTVDQRSSPEVAAELGMTKKAVRQAKYRVKHRVLAELDGMLD